MSFIHPTPRVFCFTVWAHNVTFVENIGHIFHAVPEKHLTLLTQPDGSVAIQLLQESFSK